MSGIIDVLSSDAESLESFGHAFMQQRTGGPGKQRDERLPSQALSIPRPLLHLHNSSSTNGQVERSIMQIVLLEHDAVYVNNDHTLFQRSLSAVERAIPISSVVQQGILDLCSLPDSHADGFFALSTQGAVLYFGAKQRKEALLSPVTLFHKTKLFSLPHFFVSTSAPHTQRTHMCTQDSEGLLVVCTAYMVYILTYDLRSFVQDDGGGALVGAISFPMPLSYASSRHLQAAALLEALPLDEPHQLEVWLPPSDGSRSALVVCRGNGVWLDTWVVSMAAVVDGDDPLWELQDADCLDAVRVTTPHDVWLTATSRRPRAWSERSTERPLRRKEVYATGDGQGNVCFWSLASAAAGPAFEFKSTRPCTEGDSAVTCILLERDDTSLLWVGDETGLATQFCVDIVRRRLEVLRKVNPGSVCPISELQWLPSDALLEGRLRVLCLGGGVAFECVVNEAVQSVSSVWPEPPHPPGHRSHVEVCAVVFEYDLVVVAGFGGAAFVYDFAGNRLVCTIPSPDRFFTSIAAAACGSGDDEYIKVIFGHSNGHSHEFRMVATADYDVAARTDNAGGTDFARAFSAFDVLSLGEGESEQPVLNEGRKVVSSSGFAASFVASTEYCPLPVSDIIMSSLGAYFLVCFARQCIVVHSCASNQALSQLNFDNFLTEVSFVCSTDSPSASEDSLCVALLGPNNIKIFDCIAGAFLTEFELEKFQVNADIASCAVWESSIPDSDGDLRTIKGLYACHGGAIFTFGDEIGCKLMLETRAMTAQRQRLAGSTAPREQQHESAGMLISDLVVGVAPYSHGHSPLAAVWFMKKVLLLRMNLNTGFPVATKLFEFNVGDTATKSRVIAACALRTAHRATSHRVLVVTSDGTAITLQLS